MDGLFSCLSRHHGGVAAAGVAAGATFGRSGHLWKNLHGLMFEPSAHWSATLANRVIVQFPTQLD